MRMPGFTAEASLHQATAKMHGESGRRAAPDGLSRVLPQLGIGGSGGFGGGGITYPPGDDDCYCCVGWVRCPCGLA